MNFTRKDFDLNAEYMRRKQQAAQHEQLVQLVSAPNIGRYFTLADALEICKSIQKDQMTKWLSPAAWQCRVCIARSKAGVPGRLVHYHGVCQCPKIVARRQLAFQHA